MSSSQLLDLFTVDALLHSSLFSTNSLRDIRQHPILQVKQEIKGSKLVLLLKELQPWEV